MTEGMEGLEAGGLLGMGQDLHQRVTECDSVLELELLNS